MGSKRSGSAEAVRADLAMSRRDAQLTHDRPTGARRRSRRPYLAFIASAAAGARTRPSIAHVYDDMCFGKNNVNNIRISLQ
ncbi:unnamed protein product [Colias eurytheme]|nr:unnamed protein product [Colias eurytheme]